MSAAPTRAREPALSCSLPRRRAAGATRARRGARARRARGPPRAAEREADRSMSRATDRRTSRQPDRRAVGIAPHRVDVVGHRVGQLVDRNIDRALEADDDDGAGGSDLGFDVFREFQEQPGETAAGRQRGLALHRFRSARAGKHHLEQDQAGHKQNASTEATPGRPRGGAGLRPKSSGSRSRHCKPSLSVQRVSNQSPARRADCAPLVPSNLELAI